MKSGRALASPLVLSSLSLWRFCVFLLFTATAVEGAFSPPAARTAVLEPLARAHRNLTLVHASLARCCAPPGAHAAAPRASSGGAPSPSLYAFTPPLLPAPAALLPPLAHAPGNNNITDALVQRRCVPPRACMALPWASSHHDARAALHLPAHTALHPPLAHALGNNNTTAALVQRRCVPPLACTTLQVASRHHDARSLLASLLAAVRDFSASLALEVPDTAAVAALVARRFVPLRASTALPKASSHHDAHAAPLLPARTATLPPLAHALGSNTNHEAAAARRCALDDVGAALPVDVVAAGRRFFALMARARRSILDFGALVTRHASRHMALVLRLPVTTDSPQISYGIGRLCWYGLPGSYRIAPLGPGRGPKSSWVKKAEDIDWRPPTRSAKKQSQHLRRRQWGCTAAESALFAEHNALFALMYQRRGRGRVQRQQPGGNDNLFHHEHHGFLFFGLCLGWAVTVAGPYMHDSLRVVYALAPGRRYDVALRRCTRRCTRRCKCPPPSATSTGPPPPAKPSASTTPARRTARPCTPPGWLCCRRQLACPSLICSLLRSS